MLKFLKLAMNKNAKILVDNIKIIFDLYIIIVCMSHILNDNNIFSEK